MLLPKLLICGDCLRPVTSLEDLERDRYADTCRGCGSTNIDRMTKAHAVAISDRLEVQLTTNSALADLKALHVFIEHCRPG